MTTSQETVNAASRMINTSVEDLRSSLHCDLVKGTLDLSVMRIARSMAMSRGMDTKVKILKSFISKLESEKETKNV